MLALVVDTAGPAGGVLLARNDSASQDVGETKVLGAKLLETRGFSTHLVSALAELLESNRLTLASVDALVVVTGPGSFTGLRVGLGAVKAMAEVTAKPIIAVSRLAIMASSAAVIMPQEAAEGPVHVALDAGRGEFYYGVYHDAGWTCVRESLEIAMAIKQSVEQAPGPLVASEAAVLTALAGLAPRQCPFPTSQEAFPLVLAAWHARRFTDVALLDANYLRRIDPPIVSTSANSAKSAGNGLGGA